MKTFSYEEALKLSLEYFKGDDLAAKVFVDKYALKDADGEILEPTPKEMHQRLAKELARAESKFDNGMNEQEIFDLLDYFKYIVLQGSPMSAIGNPHKLQSLGNCFVIESPYDSYGGICKSDQELAQLMKRRAGVGLDLSNIRPKGLPTNNAAGTTDGIGVFMERFSNTCREVAQNGRRGAEMQSISINHPEVETFITIKQDKKKVTGANVSVRLTDEFMQSVKDNKEFTLKWPVESKNPTITKTINARDLWNTIVNCAWSSAEPGIFFWDNVINNSPADIYGDVNPLFKTRSSNPCGEIVMGVDSCRLTVVNLLSFVKNPFTDKAKFDYKFFAEVVIKAQRIMDDIVELELEQIQKILDKVASDPEPAEVKSVEIKLWKGFLESCKAGRRTGLGITALGDCLAALGVQYGSEESIKITEKIYKNLAINAYKSSAIMAKERGAFPLFDRKLEKGHSFISRIINSDEELLELYNKYGRRNIALTTTAPTGSVSTLTQTSSGIEPVFLLSYTRRKKINPSDKNAKVDFVDALGDRWQEFTIYHHGVKTWMDISGEKDIKKSPYWGATSNEIDWIASVDIQAVAQKWICHSISKTCNLPKDVSKDVVSNIYMKAWESGCKGFTIYRDGCRDGVLIANDTKEVDKHGRPNKITQVEAPKRPTELVCDIHQATVKGQKWTVLVGLLNDAPYEIFTGHSETLHLPTKCNKGKIIKEDKGHYNLYVDVNGEDLIIKNIIKTFDNPESAWATRMISLSMRHGVAIDFIVDQLSRDGGMGDINKIISRILKKYIADGAKVRTSGTCPSCNGKDLIYQEGCISCPCGFSKCG